MVFLMVFFGPKLTSKCATASLTWDPSPDAAAGKVTGYKFYYSTQSFTSLPANVSSNPAFTIVTSATTTISLPNLIAGQTYFMTVTAFNATEESVPANILVYTVPGASPLSVAITSPSSPLSVLSTDTVTINASATGPNAITKVEFFDGAALLGSKTTAPYSLQKVFSVGAHVLTAKVTDALNNTATSSSVTITSAAPQNLPPLISITAPANNAQFSFGQSIAVGVSVSDLDGTVTRVEFYDGAALFGTKTAAPYSITFSGIASGSHTLTAKAFDDAGGATTSAPINITVAAPPNSSPSVAITSPANNAQFSSGQSVSITANATDSDGTVARVEFYDGSTLVGTRTASPYTVTISSMTSGSHALTAKAVDNLGAINTSATVNISVAAPNTPPTVAIISPANNAQFSSGQSVSITANATDSDGTVARVEFYDGSTLVGTRTASPYTVTISSMTSGSHALTAKAVDNFGSITTSAQVNISVAAPNTPPTVAIISPANNAQFSSSQSVSITANATDSDGTVARVEFYDGSTLVGTTTASPYSVTVSSMTSGSHALTAKAVDNFGSITTSAQVNISVAAPNTPPTIVIISPANNAQFSSGQSVTITASATDSDGTVARVEFYDGSTLVGTRTASPYSISVSGLAAGSHSLAAKAVDNSGAITTSAAVNISLAAPNTPPTIAITSPVNNAQFSSGQSVAITANAADSDGTVSRVEFYDGSTLVGTQTASPYSVSLSGLASGSHSLTARAVDNSGAVTTSAVVNISVAAPNTPPTVAIISPANNAQFSSGQSVTITANAADSDGTVSRVEFYDGSTLVGTQTTSPYSVSISGLASGSHSITAKGVDNSGAVTTSAVVNISVAAPNTPPTVAIISPANNAQFSSGQSVTITATASDSDGTVARVEFYDGSTLVGTQTASPYSVTLSSMTSGSHALTAKAVDNFGAITTSAQVNVSVAAPNIAPAVAITSPANNAQFSSGQSVTIAANASDSDGTISRVEFYDGATLVGTQTASPYSVSISSLASGSHSLTAKAVDNSGAATASAVVNISVAAPNTPPTVAIISPANNAQFSSGQSITITATASDSDGTISRVDFYDGSTLIGTKTASPYSVSVSSLASGSHVLTAKAVDDLGALTTSAQVNVSIDGSNSLPTVSLTGLTEGALLSQPVVLTASASDSDGTVSSVEFFADDTSLGTSSAAPFSVSVSIVSGTYIFKAKAVDNAGGVSFSAPITASVKPAPPVDLVIK
jgi:predicted phage tail protein